MAPLAAERPDLGRPAANVSLTPKRLTEAQSRFWLFIGNRESFVPFKEFPCRHG